MSTTGSANADIRRASQFEKLRAAPPIFKTHRCRKGAVPVTGFSPLTSPNVSLFHSLTLCLPDDTDNGPSRG